MPQVDDLAQLLEHLKLPPAILIGHSSGARLFGRYAFAHPDRVRALVLCLLTGGRKAAKELAKSCEQRGPHPHAAPAFATPRGRVTLPPTRPASSPIAAASSSPIAADYSRFANMIERAGIDGVLANSFFAERACLNASVAPYLRKMAPDDFAAAYRGSARLLLDTRDEPALGLPAAALDAVRAPALVVNYYGPGDGMHTAEVTRAVAAAIPGADAAVVSQDPEVWWGRAIVPFLERHSSERVTSRSTDR